MLFVILILVACLTPFATDIYIPSFFSLSKDLGTNLNNIQLTMSIYMFALAISQLVYGPLSDAFGRRSPLLIGLVIMLMGSILCTFSTSIEILFLGRFIQGLGAGACASLWRAIFRDAFDAQQMAKYGGYLGIVMVYIVSAAPFLGGYLEATFSWQASFIAIIFYTLSLLILIPVFLPETSQHHSKDRLNLTFMKESFLQLFKSRIFMGYAFCVFLTYGAFFSWFVIGPVLLMDHFHFSPEKFGTLNLLLGGSAMALGSMVNGKLVGRLGAYTMLRLGWGLIIGSGLLMLSTHMLFEESLVFILSCLFIFLFGGTLIWPNTFAGAFTPFGAIAGYAGSLYSFFQVSGGAFWGSLSSFLPETSPYTLPFLFIFTAGCAWAIFELILKKAEQKGAC